MQGELLGHADVEEGMELLPYCGLDTLPIVVIQRVLVREAPQG